MKTTTTNTFRGNSFPVIQSGILSFLLLLSLVFTSGLSAQNKTKMYESFGLRVSSSISANRFGGIYSPAVFYKSGRNVYTAGLLFQKEGAQVTGAQTSYEYTVLDGRTGECYIPWLELYAFASVAYYNRAFLDNNVCMEEHQQNPELKTDLNAVQLKALDSYAGFGLRVTFLKNFKWFGCIGLGAYDALNVPAGLYYNTHSVGMLYRTGISYQFNRTGNRMNF